MSDLSSTSFIPKHTPNKTERKSSPKQVYFGTLLVQILFFAVIIATIGVFIYERKLSADLAEEVDSFKSAATTYVADTERLEQVLSMDKRLLQASDLLKSSVSVASLLKAIEVATIETVQLVSFELSREAVEEITLTAGVKTNNFDSTMFQRSIFEDNDILSNTDLEDVTIQTTIEKREGEQREGEQEEVKLEDSYIEFNAIIKIDPTDVPAVIVTESSFIPYEETNTVINDTVTDSSAVVGNQ